jgi:rhodanese-related sulfurtransferase
MTKLKSVLAISVCIIVLALLVEPLGAVENGFKEVSAPEVKSLIENKKAVVINLLSQIEFSIQHIPDSINIPIVDFEKTEKLPQQKDTPLVLYCMGKR